MNKLYLFFALVLLSSCSYIEMILPVEDKNNWGVNYGGASNDILMDIEKCGTGYLLAGYSASYDNDVISGNNGEYDFWLMKIDSVGRRRWVETYGGSKSDYLSCLYPLKDGNFIVGGATNSSDRDVRSNKGDYDFWFMKISDRGSIKWNKTYGGSDRDYLYDLIETDENKLLFVGYTNSFDGDVQSFRHDTIDAWIMQTDNAGVIEWEKSYGGSLNDGIIKIKASGENFILAGYSYSNDGDPGRNQGFNDFWALKIDKEGEIIWSKTYGGSGSEVLYDMITLENGHSILAGISTSKNGDVKSSSNGGSDYWVVEIDEEGTLIWENTYGGSTEDILRSITATGDGYLLGGYSSSTNGDVTSETKGKSDAWIVKIDLQGNIVWNKSIGGSEDELVSKIYHLGGSKFLLGGSTSSTDKDITTELNGLYDYWVFATDTIK